MQKCEHTAFFGIAALVSLCHSIHSIVCVRTVFGTHGAFLEQCSYWRFLSDSTTVFPLFFSQHHSLSLLLLLFGVCGILEPCDVDGLIQLWCGLHSVQSHWALFSFVKNVTRNRVHRKTVSEFIRNSQIDFSFSVSISVVVVVVIVFFSIPRRFRFYLAKRFSVIIFVNQM